MKIDEIQALRNDLKMTQSEFAKILGVSFSTISRWEKGISEPNDTQKEQMKALKDLINKKDVSKEKLKKALLVMGLSGTIVTALASGLALAGPMAGATLALFKESNGLNNLFKKGGEE